MANTEGEQAAERSARHSGACRFEAGGFSLPSSAGAAQISQIWRARVRRRSGSSSRRFGRQTPGQGPWPGEPNVRQLQHPPDNATGDHGRLPPVTPGHLGRRGRLIPVSPLRLHSQLKTSNLFPEIMICY